MAIPMLSTTAATTLNDGLRARSVARDHPRLPVAKRGFFAVELELERARL